jgi:hypothetical protein
MESLLGQFYNRIKGSQEDIASESLTYILRKSIRVRQTINQIININTGLSFSDLSYTTQKVGDKLERPDISGIDENGREALIIEAKFWASLTSNQPNEYLNRFIDNAVLIFLVPTLRVRSIYEEVLIRVNENHADIETDTENRKIRINSDNIHILIKSWNEILNAIKSELLKENNQNLISDIDQIIGFCDTIDKNSFQPIIDIDLSPSIPKKINSYYDIVDKVVDEIKIRSEKVSTKGLIKTPQRYGYRRYFRFGNFGVGLGLKMDLWAVYADTPFWMSVKIISENSWIITDKFKRKCEKLALQQNLKLIERNDELSFSLKPKLNETEDRVIDDLANQVELICNKIAE